MNDVHAGLLGDDRAARAARAARRRAAAEGVRRPVLGALACGLVAGAVAWFLGMHTPHAVLTGLGVVGLVLVGVTFDPRPDERWSREPSPDRHGARTELAHLSWTMRGRDGRVGERVVQRLLRTATSRLARVGLRLDDPEDAARAAQLLGPRAWSTLHPSGGRMPRFADVEHTVSRLEALVPAVPPDPAARTDTSWTTADPPSATRP
ncbi:hypothetical protein [Cellulomonas cellasea]|uniref:Uncharacterized protein n=1 Tax=Cellulomonas cellasea TaxID=43670 RepID=A0A7W4UFX7_9CELL|nr:hypothetical protein [Cellulomonas cellasea]MBB2923458.1 hypothetical protein [Cellulomonas cellasea]